MEEIMNFEIKLSENLSNELNKFFFSQTIESSYVFNDKINELLFKEIQSAYIKELKKTRGEDFREITERLINISSVNVSDKYYNQFLNPTTIKVDIELITKLVIQKHSTENLCVNNERFEYMLSEMLYSIFKNYMGD